MNNTKQAAINGVHVVACWCPWWNCTLLAAVSYTLSSLYISQVTASHGFHSFAFMGQSILPAIFLTVSAVSAYQHFFGSDFSGCASVQKRRFGMDLMNSHEFELLVAEGFKNQGYRVIVKPDNCDGGVDLQLTKNNKIILVHCKHWQSQEVGIKTARKLYNKLLKTGADEVSIGSSGQFSEDAKAFVSGKPIYLIGAEQLLSLVANDH